MRTASWVFSFLAMLPLLLVTMSCRILDKPALIRNCAIYLDRRHNVFFREPMTENCLPRMKEIENSVLNVSIPHSKFMDPTPKEVCLRPPQFVPHLRQPLDPNNDLVAHFRLQPVHPIEQRHGAVFSGEKHNLRLRHAYLDAKYRFK